MAWARPACGHYTEPVSGAKDTRRLFLYFAVGGVRVFARSCQAFQFAASR